LQNERSTQASYLTLFRFGTLLNELLQVYSKTIAVTTYHNALTKAQYNVLRIHYTSSCQMQTLFSSTSFQVTELKEDFSRNALYISFSRIRGIFSAFSLILEFTTKKKLGQQYKKAKFFVHVNPTLVTRPATSLERCFKPPAFCDFFQRSYHIL
jgi:hypothetical protein